MTTVTTEHVIERRVELGRGHSAPISFYAAVADAAEAVIPDLAPDRKFKAEHVCGPNFWVKLSPSQARLAGRCLAHLVLDGSLPLAIHERKGTCLRYIRR